MANQQVSTAGAQLLATLVQQAVYIHELSYDRDTCLADLERTLQAQKKLRLCSTVREALFASHLKDYYTKSLLDATTEACGEAHRPWIRPVYLMVSNAYNEIQSWAEEVTGTPIPEIDNSAFDAKVEELYQKYA